MAADPIMRTPNPMAHPPVRPRGVTLIESLVALLVLSFGVMGVVALQGRALQYAVDAEDRNRAALLADNRRDQEGRDDVVDEADEERDRDGARHGAESRKRIAVGPSHDLQLRRVHRRSHCKTPGWIS